MAFTDVLNRLFTSKIILKKMPGNRLKLIDFNKYQASPEAHYGTNSLARKTRYISGYSTDPNIEQIEALRQQYYMDYELMDSDPILAAALDIYSDECTARSAQGDLLTIKTNDSKVKSVLYDLFYSVLNIEFNLWSWIRTTCKYGDLFLYLEIQPTVGIVDVLPIHPAFIRRVEEESKTYFKYEGDINRHIKDKDFDDWEIAHFRMLSDTNFLPYGKSMIDGAKKVFKQLLLLEDAMLLHRIMRAPERRVFKVDVGNIPPDEVDSYIDQLSNEMKKVPYMDETGQYNLRFNLQNMMEDYILPTRGGNSTTDITTLEGLQNDGAIDDIEYVRDKMMAFLKIPKAFLGYQSMGDVKTSLAAEDIRFARTIERIQKIIVSELYKIAYIHLKVQGFSNKELGSFDLELAPPSMIYQRQKIDLLNEQLNVIQNIKDNKIFSNKYIYENIFNLSEDQWKREEDLIIEDLKESFRRKQIEDEGNDPKQTGTAVGTAHSIASMHVARKSEGQEDSEFNPIKKLYSKDGREDNEGRPEKGGSYGRHKDPAFGLDPTGEGEMYSATKGESIYKKYSTILDDLNIDRESKQILKESKLRKK